ncbi:MAG: xylose isomerase [Ignavibacteria bacterium]|nr:MAG: xylose isomerase [Ignavibacteria bacterium]KAF0160977.1 MAG: xylose isomerase [Ignavibacteria bacterium]
MLNLKKMLVVILVLVMASSINAQQTKEEVNYNEVKIREFKIAVQCWTFRKFTFVETLQKVKELGVKYLEAYPGQKLGSDDPNTIFNYDMSEENIAFVKKKLDEAGIKLTSFGVVGFENTESATKKVFEFAKKMGIQTIVTEPSTDDFSLLNKFVKQYGINVAIHNHPEPSKYAKPQAVADRIKGLDTRIGSCGDTGHWMRTSVNPIEALKLLSGRVIELHLKDLNEFGSKDAYDVPFGSGKANIHDILAELTIQNFRGYLVVEHENPKEADNPSPSIKKGLDYIESITYYKGFQELLSYNWGRYEKHGWNHYGPGYFELDPKSGILTSNGGMGLLWFSQKKYGDFILDLEYKCLAPKTNSGIFLRVPDFVTSDDYIYRSFEIQIDDASEKKHQTGAVYDSEPAKEKAFKPTGNWNHYRISFIGDVITVVLNGTEIINWKAEPRGKIKDFAKNGYVGLQNHDSDAKVSFRNIFVKELK